MSQYEELYRQEAAIIREAGDNLRGQRSRSAPGDDDGAYCVNCHGVHRGAGGTMVARQTRSSTPYTDYLRKTEAIGLSTCPHDQHSLVIF